MKKNIPFLIFTVMLLLIGCNHDDINVTVLETKKTTTGAVYQRVMVLGYEHVHGVLWKDPRGLIWGDVIRKADGSIYYRNDSYGATNNPCKALSDQFGLEEIRLPTKEEFELLRKDMGYGTAIGYTAQILPNLNYWFWSSSVHPDHDNFVFVFGGEHGGIDFDSRYFGAYNATRCVAR